MKVLEKLFSLNLGWFKLLDNKNTFLTYDSSATFVTCYIFDYDNSLAFWRSLPIQINRGLFIRTNVLGCPHFLQFICNFFIGYIRILRIFGIDLIQKFFLWAVGSWIEETNKKYINFVYLYINILYLL